MLILEPIYCKTRGEARKEMERRRAADSEGVIVKCDKSPYGGFRVYSIPVDSYVDDLLDPILKPPKSGRYAAHL